MALPSALRLQGEVQLTWSLMAPHCNVFIGARETKPRALFSTKR